MTQVDHIRKAYFEEGQNITQIAEIFSCDRKTVRKYLAIDDFNQPAPHPKRATAQPKLDPFKAIIDNWLVDDLNYQRKQRHTARRVYTRLEKEVPDFNCSYRTVATYVKAKKQQLYKPAKGALPLEHQPGEAQVDFGTADFYEWRSVILTTNLEFSRWVSIFYDEQMTAAIIDRLVHHSYLLIYDGPSNRMRGSLMRQGG